jgi:protease I
MKKIAVLIEDGYEDLEVWYPTLRLIEEGYVVKLVSPDGKQRLSKHGYPAEADMKSTQLRAKDFDAVIIPGGIKGAENLRMFKHNVDFVKEMHDARKIIGSICHGAWILISAFIVKGKNITCYHGIKDDVIAAGGIYEDKEVIVDDNIVTSRKPDDLPAFMKEILKKLR